jgi:hypothetical protein
MTTALTRRNPKATDNAANNDVTEDPTIAADAEETEDAEDAEEEAEEDVGVVGSNSDQWGG